MNIQIDRLTSPILAHDAVARRWEVPSYSVEGTLRDKAAQRP